MSDGTEPPDEGEAPPGMPWWVKVIGIAVLAILLLALAITLIGGGRHGPGLHGSSAAEWRLSSAGADQEGGWREVSVG